MQIVKIYPKTKSKIHFSIRQNWNQFYVFEGDKVLRSNLKSQEEAELEIEQIVRMRKENNSFNIPVNYKTVNTSEESEIDFPKETIDIVNVGRKICKGCNNVFLYDTTKRGSFRKLYCTTKCSITYNNQKRYKLPSKNNNIDENGLRKCKACKELFKPKRRDSLNCSQKCSNFSYNDKLRKQKIRESKKLNIIPTPLPTGYFEREKFNKTEQADEISKRKSIENAITDAHFMKETMPETFRTLSASEIGEVLNTNPEVANEFHELTEKQMSFNSRLKKRDYLANDIIDYIILWCELNEKLGSPQNVSELFYNLERLKLTDLLTFEIVEIMPELIDSSEGYLRMANFDFNDDFEIFLIKQKLIKLLKDGLLPSEEQYNRALFLKPMLSQMLFTKIILNKQNNKEVEEQKQEKPLPVSNSFDTVIFQGILEMIQNISNQNKIIDGKVNECIEIRAKSELTNMFHKDSLVNIEKHLKEISKRVEEITKKRRGIFG